MKLIMAVIKPFRLDEVREALTQIGVEGLTKVSKMSSGASSGASPSPMAVSRLASFVVILPKGILISEKTTIYLVLGFTVFFFIGMIGLIMGAQADIPTVGG